MLSALFTRETHKFSIDLEVLHDPTLLVQANGLITHTNTAFTQALGWKHDELVNESVHMLIPLRIISKKAHDDKMQNYKYGTKSNFIGYDKILPIKDNKESERLFRVQIVPVQKAKTLTFLAFFKAINFDFIVLNSQSLLSELQTRLKKLPADYNFQEQLVEHEDQACLRIAREYINGDLLMLSSLISANYHIAPLIDYAVTLIANPITNHLKKMKQALFRYSEHPHVYLNFVCLRLLFPHLYVNNPNLHSPLKKVFETIYKKSISILGEAQPESMMDWTFSVVASSNNTSPAVSERE